MADLRDERGDPFDAETVEPSSVPTVIPPGRYSAIIVESGMKRTKAGDGKYLQLTFQIEEGNYKGRKLWARLNLDNPNLKAVEIARADLSAICRAVGVIRAADSEELHNLPLMVTVMTRDTGRGPQSEIKAYSKRDTPGVPPQAPTWVPPSDRDAPEGDDIPF